AVSCQSCLGRCGEMADRDLRFCLYTADDGTQYRTKQDATIIAQESGGSPITGAVEVTGADTHQELPALLKPRRVYVRHSGQNQRSVVCMTSTAALYVGTATSVNLQQLGGAAVAYSRHKAASERDHRKAAGIEG